MEHLEVKCALPQGSLLQLLLFLIDVNDLHEVSHLLTPMKFTGDVDLHLGKRNITELN